MSEELSELMQQVDMLNAQGYIIIVLMGVLTGILLWLLFWRDVR